MFLAGMGRGFVVWLGVVGFVLLCAPGAWAEVIYAEDFTGQVGKGAVGSGTGAIIDLSGVEWDIDVSGAKLDSTGDWFDVRDNGGNEQLEGHDLDGRAVWMSPVIDVSHHESVEFALFAEGVGDFEGGDHYEVAYQLDGAPAVTVFEFSGVTGPDPTVLDQTVTSSVGDGNSLILQVFMENSADNEYFRLDDVEVTGDLVPEPGAGVLFLLAAVLVGLRRGGRKSE